MKMPRQNDPVSVSSIGNAPIHSRGWKVVLLVVSLLGFASECRAQSELSSLSDFVSGKVNTEIQSSLKGAGKPAGPGVDTSPQAVYQELLRLKVRRQRYTDALENYLAAVRSGEGIFEREQDYVIVEDAATQLRQSVTELMKLVTSMGLALDLRDERIRVQLGGYTGAKGAQIDKILKPTRFLGMSEVELASAVQDAKSTGALLDASMKTLLAEIRRDHPEVASMESAVAP